MQQGPLHNSSKLSPVVKQALESLRGRTLEEPQLTRFERLRFGGSKSISLRSMSSLRMYRKKSTRTPLKRRFAAYDPPIGRCGEDQSEHTRSRTVWREHYWSNSWAGGMVPYFRRTGASRRVP